MTQTRLADSPSVLCTKTFAKLSEALTDPVSTAQQHNVRLVNRLFVRKAVGAGSLFHSDKQDMNAVTQRVEGTKIALDITGDGKRRASVKQDCSRSRSCSVALLRPLRRSCPHLCIRDITAKHVLTHTRSAKFKDARNTTLHPRFHPSALDRLAVVAWRVRSCL